MGAIVAPLRGFCWFPLATGGFAALHPRLFDLRRSAAVCRTIRTPARSLMRRNGNAPRDLSPPGAAASTMFWGLLVSRLFVSFSHGALPMNQSPALNRGQWMVLIAAFLGWMFDGVEIGLFPLVARPALQELLREHGRRGGRRVEQRHRGVFPASVRRRAGWCSAGSATRSAACARWSSAS